MSFFDDLGKKLSQAGQTAAQKTKEIAETAKLNSQISDEEKKINDFYLQIGKLYVSLHNEDYEADFDELVKGLHESENRVKECRQQIKDIKGVTMCEKCGAEVSSGAAFCSTCGAPMPVASPAEPETAPGSSVEVTAEIKVEETTANSEGAASGSGAETVGQTPGSTL